MDQQVRCRKQPDTIDVNVSLDKVKSAAQQGHIDNPSHLKNQKVFLFSGLKDDVVLQGEEDMSSTCALVNKQSENSSHLRLPMSMQNVKTDPYEKQLTTHLVIIVAYL